MSAVCDRSRKKAPIENQLDQTTHSYSVDLNLHHLTRDPGEITKALAIEPWFAKRRGELVGGIEHKTTSWLCHFHKGAGNNEFGKTLKKKSAVVVTK